MLFLWTEIGSAEFQLSQVYLFIFLWHLENLKYKNQIFKTKILIQFRYFGSEFRVVFTDKCFFYIGKQRTKKIILTSRNLQNIIDQFKMKRKCKNEIWLIGNIILKIWMGI